jgi:hypothetical protein
LVAPQVALQMPVRSDALLKPAVVSLQHLSLVQITRDDLVQQLRNQGKGGQTKISRFHGVMKHAKDKWEARLGQHCGSKYQYLGLFCTEIDAAVAYDRASVAQKGLDAATNFSFENYPDLLGVLITIQNISEPVHTSSCCSQVTFIASGVHHVPVHHLPLSSSLEVAFLSG